MIEKKTKIGACAVALVAAVLVTAPCAAADADANVSLVLETNKKSYLGGEPVLLRTTLRNDADEPYAVGRFRFISPGGQYAHLGFNVHVSRDGVSLGTVFRRGLDAGQSTVPVHYEGLCDRYYFPGEVAAGLTLYRLDVCAFGEPGTYRLKAAFAGEEDRRLESEEVSVTVVPFDEADDPIVKVLSQDEMAGFGYSFVNAFYLDGEVINFGSGLTWDELQPIVEAILARGHESAFYPYARYLSFLRDRDRTRGGGTGQHPLATKQAIAAGETFLKDYPESWLAPDVMRLLFFTHLANKEPAKALEVGKKALVLDPVPAVVPASRIAEQVEELKRTVAKQASSAVVKGAQ